MILTDPDFEPFNKAVGGGSGLIDGKFQLLAGIKVLVAPDADILIKDGSGGTQYDVIPASTGKGTWIESGNTKYVNGVYMDINSATTGTFAFSAKKYIKGAG